MESEERRELRAAASQHVWRNQYKKVRELLSRSSMVESLGIDGCIGLAWVLAGACHRPVVPLPCIGCLKLIRGLILSAIDEIELAVRNERQQI